MSYAKGQGAANPTTLVVTGKSSPAAQGTAGPTRRAGRPPITCHQPAYLRVSSPSPRLATSQDTQPGKRRIERY